MQRMRKLLSNLWTVRDFSFWRAGIFLQVLAAPTTPSTSKTAFATALALKTLALFMATGPVLRFAFHALTIRIPAASAGASRTLLGGASLRALGGRALLGTLAVHPLL